MAQHSTERRLYYGVTNNIRMCCCNKQSHLDDAAPQRLVLKPEWQIRNLSTTFKEEVEYKAIWEIREYFHASEIAFRYAGCPRNSMSCCGSCTKVCHKRCPQDVLNRAYLLCANILNAPDEVTRKERYEVSDTSIQLLYDAFTTEAPKYFVIFETVTHIISPYYNEKLRHIIEEVYDCEDSPHRLDYAPVIEYEQAPGTHPMEQKFRKKVDEKTGEVSVLHWPRSGMCPFCLPIGLSDRRRGKRADIYGR